MTVKLMRIIDYWIGRPLCFFLTQINCVLSFFSCFRRRQDDSPKKILFIKLSEMGSIVLAYPLIRRVRKEYPESEIFFLTFRNNKPLVKILNIIASCNILTIRENGVFLFVLDSIKSIKKLGSEKIDIVFDLEFFSRFSAIVSYLTGAHKRIGFYNYCIEGLYRGNFLTHRVQYNPLINIAKSYLSLSQVVRANMKLDPGLDSKIEDKEIYLPRYISSTEAKTKILDKIKQLGISVSERSRLIVFNPGEGNIPLREWPLENFIDLAKMLLGDNKIYIIIAGTEKASEKAGYMSKVVDNKRCLNLVGKTTISELLALFDIAQALVTNDCGLGHIASLTSIKRFVLFGPEAPQVFSPLGGNTSIIYANLPCSPCLSVFNHRNSACKDNKCLKIIKPEEVYRVVKRDLK